MDNFGSRKRLFRFALYCQNFKFKQTAKNAQTALQWVRAKPFNNCQLSIGNCQLSLCSVRDVKLLIFRRLRAECIFFKPTHTKVCEVKKKCALCVICGKLPNFPRSFVLCPKAFKQIFVTESIHALPETVVGIRHKLTASCSLFKGIFFKYR